MNIAVILAGGVGSRLGADIPKQFIKVLDKPVIAYTIEAFQKHNEVDAILMVCVHDWMEEMQRICDEYGFTKVKWITEGGDTFQESVMNGVHFLDGKVDRKDMLLIHFGASPFIEEPVITDAIRVCREKGNAIKLTARVLRMLSRHSALRICRIDGGGKDNAIPVRCSTLFTSDLSFSNLLLLIQQMEEAFRAELEFSDPGVTLELSEDHVTETMTEMHSNELIQFLYLFPT